MPIQKNPDGSIQRAGLPPEYLKQIRLLNDTNPSQIYYLSCEHTPEQIEKLKLMFNTLEQLVLLKLKNE